MVGMIFTASVSLGLPLILLCYAYYKRRMIPFVLGVAAFLLSQVFLRIPILQYVSENFPSYTIFSMTNPVLFALIIGFSAGLFEECARFIFMTYWMKQRDWQAGFLFGAGHGGIEAVLLVGIPVLSLLFAPTNALANGLTFIGGIERFFAMMLHIGLSIMVLQAVVQKRVLIVVLAIILHGLVNSFAVILPLYVSQGMALLIVEGTLIFVASSVFIYVLWIKRKGFLE